ncbi:MAG: dockerin type I repeat-containing protein [candidate division Zixibacteria bacterium]|nr:dockerin type I repeat-containing protein [candidate division Zixibacteria bacterium]
MTSRNFKRIFILLVVTFIFSGLAVDRVCAQVRDTLAHIAIAYTPSYPGNFTEVEVKLKNDVPIAGFQFLITIGNPDLINFHTDSVGIATAIDTLWRDTCTVGPDSLHGDSCWVVDSVLVHEMLVRYCYIDTVGSLISNFEFFECHGDTGDTSLPDCKWIKILGIAKYNHPIPENPSYQTLFKFGVDVFCLPDSTTDRLEPFYMFPGVLNFLADEQGDLVPYEYHQGVLDVYRSVPGDANADSIVNLGDITYLINYLYRQGNPPCIPEAGDANGDCAVNLGDIVTLIGYLFRGGAPPVPGCWYGKKE